MPNDFILHRLDNQTLIEVANKLPRSGILIRDGDYAFLKISEDYIEKLFPLLEGHEKLYKPLYPAHISLIYPEEECYVSDSDVGSLHSFELLDLYTTQLFGKHGWLMTVSAPSLEQLRKKYNLPKKLCYKGHRIVFHITIAQDML